MFGCPPAIREAALGTQRKNQNGKLSVIGQQALEYASRGWAVFPIYEIYADGHCACGKSKCSAGKHPRISGGCKNATKEKHQIRRWWAKWPDANIGIATGKKSDFFVMDIDPKNGGDESLKYILQNSSEHPPQTMVVATGGGGFHYYFDMPAGFDVKNSAGKIAAGIDIRGTGGYVLAPPSNHVSGGLYEMEWHYPIDCAPSWLLKELEPPSNVVKFRPRKRSRNTADKYADEPKPNLKLIRKNCEWLDECHTEASALGEEDWYYAISIVARCDNGHDLAHEFSEAYPIYTPEETGEKIKHALEAAGPVNCQTVASKLGHGEHCSRCQYFGKITSPIQLGHSPHPLMEQFVYLKKQACFYDLNTGTTYEKASFNAAHAHLSGGKSLANKFLASPDLRKPLSLTYEPRGPLLVPEGIEDMLNTWKPSGVEPVEGDAGVFIDHMAYMFPDERERGFGLIAKIDRRLVFS